MAPSAFMEPQLPVEGVKFTTLKSPNSPLPKVQEFDAASATTDGVVNAIKVAGGVIVRNLVRREDVEHIERDVRPHLDKDTPWSGKQPFSSKIRRRSTLNERQATFSLPRLVEHLAWSASLALLRRRLSGIVCG